MNNLKKYFIIIVHFGQTEPTNELLKTIELSKVSWEKVVIIDHSGNFFTKTGEKYYSVIRPQDNGGYGAGINCGLGVLASLGAKAEDIILVMNNDLIIDPSDLIKIIDWWEENQHTHTIAGVMAGHVNYLTGRTTSLTSSIPKSQYYLDGRLLSAPYRTFLKLKGVPEHYFLYWEDVAFSARALAQGISLKIIPHVVVHNRKHDHPATADKLYYLVRNGAYYVMHETPLPIRLYWRALNYIRLGYHCLRSPTEQTKIIRQALHDALHNHLGRLDSKKS